MPELTESDARLLEFERTAPRSVGAKEEAIRAQFDITPTRYYQRLNLLIDLDAAMAAYPTLTARLRRIRDRRAEEKARHSDSSY
ncbi:DUF3263 domain-containing protein [Corynebacterium yudongzhengii]|uniref:DUF3263 domain-containing protein n=1 Tax=Corynebacterium yudongzhengii TaxID=2080740 RepID=A0A2U1T5Y9_9CORY|nr:DUF3263 domain-containing protein [Corynebacterium yudongzhengii]AWB83045.1 DUF3263 domain-containing protein [Corynebacterium yudongzhengii]PWC01417.1 DUF3263 domain-containing protein [Corynebacterium yudongzhengii]